MEPVVAVTSQPLGPVATAIVAGILITASVAVVVGYSAMKIRWRRDARRKKREYGDWPPPQTDIR